jgi:hypothetical protein
MTNTIFLMKCTCNKVWIFKECIQSRGGAQICEHTEWVCSVYTMVENKGTVVYKATATCMVQLLVIS